MTLLSRKTDYALLILSHLHGHASGECARTIAATYGLSKAFVANILKELCQKGFVTSQRGVKGGYCLQRPAEEIHLVELLEKLEEGFQLANCTGPHPELMGEECSVSSCCPIKGTIGELHKKILEMLRLIKLSDLIPTPRSATTLLPMLAVRDSQSHRDSGLAGEPGSQPALIHMVN